MPRFKRTMRRTDLLILFLLCTLLIIFFFTLCILRLVRFLVLVLVLLRLVFGFLLLHSLFILLLDHLDLAVHIILSLLRSGFSFVDDRGAETTVLQMTLANIEMILTAKSY